MSSVPRVSLLLMFVTSWPWVSHCVPAVTYISPTYGGTNGGTRITVYGNDFKDNFNLQNDPTAGTLVKLVGQTEYDCTLHQDGVTTTMATCYTSPMPEGVYSVGVTVNGVAVTHYCDNSPNSCKFHVQESNTPLITSLTPRSGKPDTLLRLDGRLFTSRYGGDEFSQNNREEKILKVWAEGQSCDLKDSITNEYYGIHLEVDANGNGDYGYFLCLPQNDYIGNYNISFIVEGAFGRSKPQRELLLIHSNGIAMYQMYTEIAQLSAGSGSTEGGLELQVQGRYFDDTDSKLRVTVGNTDCHVTSFTTTVITCVTSPAAATPQGRYPGNRGLRVTTVLGQTSFTGSVNWTSGDVIWVDESYYVTNRNGSHVTKMEGVFLAPWDGDYQFFLRSDGLAKLNVTSLENGTQLVTVTSSSFYGDGQGTGRVTFKKGESCMIQLLGAWSGPSSRSELSARHYSTRYLASQTGAAVAESQVLRFRTLVRPEIQQLVVRSGNTVQGQSKVQAFNITGDLDAAVVFQVLGAATDPFVPSSADPADIETALNTLPLLAEHKVTVTGERSTTEVLYTVTFPPELGDALSVEIAAADVTSAVYVEISTTPGQATLQYFQLQLGNTVTAPIPIGAKPSDVQARLLESAGVQCPAIKAVRLTGFEASDNTFSGTRVGYVEPFCGRFSGLDPSVLYTTSTGTRITASVSNKLCLACKGAGGSVRVDFRYLISPTDKEIRSASVTFTAAAGDRWQQVCDDIYSRMTKAQPGRYDYILLAVTLLRAGSPVYVDEVILLDQKTYDTAGPVGERRLNQMRPSGAFLQDVQVTGSANNYTVTLVPYLCGHDLELFSLAGADEMSGSATADSTAANFVLHSGEQQLSLDVTRVSAASKPVSGSFAVTFKNSTSQAIPVSSNPSSDLPHVKDALAQLPALDDIQLTFSGTCSAFDYTVTMVTLAGNQPLLQIDASDLGGTNVTSEVLTVTDGYALLRPLTGDMLRTLHSLPQVVVYVNDVPTSCADGVNCSFAWRTEDTPTVTGVFPASGSTGDVLTVSGTGFADQGNKVTVGDVACLVTSQTANLVNCTLPVLPGGAWPIRVTVPGKGDASGSWNVTFQSLASSVWPASGSTAGGLSLNISGEGFSSRDTVTVGGRACDVTSRTPTQIVCTLPAAEAASGGSVDVIVSQQSGNLSALVFTYDASLTPVITGVTPTTAHPWGGDHVTISGNGLAGSARVFLGQREVTVTSSTDDQITVELPPLAPQVYDVRVYVEGKGLADTRLHSVPGVTVTLAVTSVTPRMGSLYGGAVVTLSGQGFGSNSSLVRVSVGDAACDVMDVTDSRVTCRIAYTGDTFVVTNQGVRSYYDFTPRHLPIKVGDCVQWRWTTPFFVSDIAFAIRQTDNDTSFATTDGGFASPGGRTRDGVYTHCFTVAGDYSYWSGYVNDYNNFYIRGQVKVSPRPNSLADIRLTIARVEAQYDTDSSSSSSPADGDCQPHTAPLANCTPQVFSRDNSLFQFQFDACATPYVTNISRHNATTRDVIVLSGAGFGSEACQNEVTFGSKGQGVVTAVTSDSLSFSVSPSGPPPVGTREQLAVRVSNLGNALLAVSGEAGRRVMLLPAVWGLTPSRGSTAGGTTVTVTGSGLTPTARGVMVTIGQDLCSVISASETNLTCRTPRSDVSGNTTVSLVTYVGGAAVPVQCLDDACNFEYADDVTPVVSSISPSSVNSSNVAIIISGSRFGADVSSVTVSIGGATCTVTGVTDSQVECTVENIPAGTHTPEVIVDGLGSASVSSGTHVTSQPVIIQVSPGQGSLYGGTDVTITGFGFSQPLSVTIGGVTCAVTSETATQIQCVTSPHAAEQVRMRVASHGVSFPDQTFTFSSSVTPQVTSISPPGGQADTQVTVTGSGFSPTASDNIVSIGNQTANVTSASATSLQVTVGSYVTGTFPVIVRVAGLGQSGSSVTFTYTLGAVDISPTQGTTAGGQTVTLTGSGFLPGATQVNICQSVCQPLPSTPTTSTKHVCSTPPAAEGVQTVCNVTVTVNSVTKTCASQYTYSADVTPVVDSVSPTRGGTAGGTLLTVTGSGFGSTPADVVVTVGDAICDVKTISDTRLTCETNNSRSGKADVNVNVRGNGNAVKRQGAVFWYIDRWSSAYTWGGDSPPVEGDLVVIQQGQILLLDVSTPRLAFLLIQGTLMFDEANLELHADNILITDGGKLQVGTEESPFPGQFTATIMLHGHLNSLEMPLYGTKVLAVRNGTLDLHGRPTPVTWTKLAATAHVGDTEISLITPVNWQVGDQIVLPSTGHRFSQSENEVRTIASVSDNGLSLTMTKPLTYEHVVVRQEFNESGQVWVLDLRGEVGLLTHNVKVQGSVNDAWSENIPACAAGFDTGEFATQTCFQGRYGAETASDQFGAHIMAHNPSRDSGAVLLRLSHVQISHAGQAFRLGRYPVHVHLNGDMRGSYVRGLGIFNSFNRAVNIHGSSNVLVEHVVLYNIMGGAFFLEDGIETNNTFQYNLAVFVRTSSSLRNDDVTPAAFWVTNPNNIVIHNAAAGGTHFGYWYRLKDFPEGPSYTSSVCPKFATLGRFENNSVHTVGNFGLWIFENFFPHKDGSCNANALTQVAVFRGLTAWNCEKGGEGVNTGAVQLHDFLLVNNEKAGYEAKLVKDAPLYDVTAGPLVRNARVVAHVGSALRQQGGVQCTESGIVLPFLDGFMVLGTRFYNFDRSTCAAFAFTRIIGTCVNLCGGFNYRTSNLSFSDSPNKVRYEWESEGVIHDLDGSLTGSPNFKVIPTTPTLPPSHCSPSPAMSVGVPGSVCDDTQHFHRFAFDNIKPSSLLAKAALFSNQYGVTRAPFTDKLLTHHNGWMTVLVDGLCYSLSFENGSPPINISYDGVFYQFNPGDALCLKQAADRPDRFMIDGATSIAMSQGPPDVRKASHGQWFYNETDRQIVYVVKRPAQRKRSVVVSPTQNDVSVGLRAYRCYYDNCQPPQDPVAVTTTPANAIRWSQASSWDWRPGKPALGENVTIPIDKWVIIDEEIPPLDFLDIQGGLSVLENTSLQVTLEVNYIKISGRLVVGWKDLPFQGKLRIRLRGDKSTPPYPVSEGPPVGAKFIAVYGGLDLHGVDPGVKWTSLGVTAQPGDATITLANPVAWSPGDEVMVTTSDLNPWHTETFRLTAVEGTVLTLNSTLAFQHLAYSKQLTSGLELKLSSRVALLTRNIVIEALPYDNMEAESFGARVVVARGVVNNVSLSGFARLKNVEFYRSGQEGYTEPTDPRYSLAYVDVFNNPSLGFENYVRDCTFHNGYSPAIGVFGVSDLPVSGNVIHHVVGTGIHTTSSRTVIDNNLVALTLWPGSYQGREEKANIQFDGAVEAVSAVDLVLRNNIVAGCERVGYHLAGQKCDVTASNLWGGNEAHACLLGVALFPGDSVVNDTCVRFSGFRVWRNRDWGLYINSVASQRISDIVAAENGAGFLPFVVGPSATGHAFQNKDIVLSNSVFVGRTDSFTCALDAADESDVNIQLSAQARGWRHGVCGTTGVVFPSFTSGSNAAPKKPFANIMAYQAIKGTMWLSNVTFAMYNSYGAGSRDFAICTNPRNDDGQHPVHVRGLHLEDVDDDSKVYFHQPNLDKVNPSDCVDMDCDGLKKAMLVDEDGSLLGTVGYVLPNSAYMWNIDNGHGVGDFRIPKAMLTDADGNRLLVNETAPFKGVYGTGNCTWRVTWDAYQCGSSARYVMAVIESLDDDTETRRLSPVALLSGGYVDLVNGPQDHGWCSGYTCRKRLSTFMTLLPLGRLTDVYLTSTVPNSMRFFLLNAEKDDCLLLSIWRSQPNRLDIYVNDTYRMPTNGYTANGRFFLRPENTPGEFLPSFQNKTTGDNYLSQREKKLYWMMCGSQPVRFQMVDVIILSLTFPAPAVSEQDFFGEQIIQNLALFFNIPFGKVRVANVVREGSASSGRRRRATGGVTYVVEIGDAPADSGEASASSVDLVDTADRIVRVIQLNGLSSVLHVPVSYVTIAEPSATDSTPVAVQRVGSLALTSHPTGAVEGRPFVVQPVLSVYDDEGYLVTNLGTAQRPWQVQAVLRSEVTGQGLLTGTTNVTFVNGTALFTDLAISLPGEDYVIDFNITYPPDAANFSLSSHRITVSPLDVAAQAEVTTSPVVVALPFNLTVHLVDKTTSSIVSNIAWRNHTWQATLELEAPEVCPGPLNGTTSATFDPATGRAEFRDLQIGKSGFCPLRVTVTSSPQEYHLTFDLFPNLLTPSQRDLRRESSRQMELKFDITYDATRAPYQAAVVCNYVNSMKDVIVTSYTYRSGSLIVALTVEGAASGVTSVLTSVCANIGNGTTLTYGGQALTFTPYMSVDGAVYYGATCGAVSDSNKTLHPGIIAAIVIACVVVILAVVLIVVWKLKVRPKTKTCDTPDGSRCYLKGEGSSSLDSEDSFMSLRSRLPVGSYIPPLIMDKKDTKDMKDTKDSGDRFQAPRVTLSTSDQTPAVRTVPLALTPHVRTITPQPADSSSTQRAMFAGPRSRPGSAEKLL